MNQDSEKIASDLKRFVSASYPDMSIRVAPWEHDEQRLAIFFTEAKFASLYPFQRWHYLSHLIPEEYYNEHLETSVWYELAPGETPDVLQYADEELIESITPDVMKCLNGARFFEHLDDAMWPQDADPAPARCWGDFRNARPILLQRGFKEEELFDVLHVLMFQGGFCDCEILYNVVEESRLKAEYWGARAEGREPYDPHAGA